MIWRWGGLVVVLLVVFVGLQIPDGKLRVVFCDVGQGDASLVTFGSFQMLVDGGPNGEKVLACLSNHMPFWDKKIELVVNSHPEKDHLTGLLEVKRRYGVGKYFDSESLQRGDTLRYGKLEMDILWPDKKVDWKVLGAGTSLNKYAVVMELTYGGFKLLYTGDITSDEERLIEAEDVDVLKVSHHGSKFSTTTEWLMRLSPEVGVISVGKNSYGHPTKEVLGNLLGSGVKIFRTDNDGTVEIVVDENGGYRVRKAKL